MANPAGTRTVSTFVPDAVYARVQAYVHMNGGTVSGFTKQSLLSALEGFPSPVPAPSTDYSTVASEYYLRMQRVLPDIAKLPHKESVPHLEEALRAVIESRPYFENACLENVKYGAAYMRLLGHVRKLLHSAQAAVAEDEASETSSRFQVTKKDTTPGEPV
jgi:hypothetical protein